jgi:hypothetical protein
MLEKLGPPGETVEVDYETGRDDSPFFGSDDFPFGDLESIQFGDLFAEDNAVPQCTDAEKQCIVAEEAMKAIVAVPPEKGEDDAEEPEEDTAEKQRVDAEKQRIDAEEAQKAYYNQQMGLVQLSYLVLVLGTLRSELAWARMRGEGDTCSLHVRPWLPHSNFKESFLALSVTYQVMLVMNCQFGFEIGWWETKMESVVELVFWMVAAKYHREAVEMSWLAHALWHWIQRKFYTCVPFADGGLLAKVYKKKQADFEAEFKAEYHAVPLQALVDKGLAEKLSEAKFFCNSFSVDEIEMPGKTKRKVQNDHGNRPDKRAKLPDAEAARVRKDHN